MRAVRYVLLAAGVVLFAVLVYEIGPATILASFSQLSWRLLVVLWFPFVLVTLCDTLGWRFAFGRDRVPFLALLSARVAGEAFNSTTPTASVGGEGVKTWLLTRHVPIRESLPSVIVAKTTITISQGLFLLLGLVVARYALGLESPLLSAMEWLLVLLALAVGGFVLVQVSGTLSRVGRLLVWSGLLRPGETHATLGELDRALAHFYRSEPLRLTLSTAGHFLGWVFSACEAYLILYFLGVPVSLETAFVIEAFGTGIRFASFMVPAHVGALEGGHVATFVVLGLDAASGLSFSLVRRLREAAWVGVGFLVLADRRAVARPAPAFAAEPEPEA